MIPTNNQALFDEAILQLGAFRASVGPGFKGRFVQIFLGLKFFQNVIPSMHSGSFVRTEELQVMLDDLFAKVSRNSDDCVFMLFQGSYLARTGVVGPGNAGPQNTWRNNFNLQKGVGCYAPPGTLASKSFQDQDRRDCQFLISGPHGSFHGASCSLKPGATYRSEAHRKWLRIDPGGNGYAAVDSMAIDNFLPYVASGGVRIPLLPLMAALYFDADSGLAVGQRSYVGPVEFAIDFNFNALEMSSYFDSSVSNPYNAATLALAPGGLAAASAVAASPAAAGVGGGGSPPYGGVAVPAAFSGGTPVLTGTVVAPPAANSGWGAQQVVFEALRADGWTVHDVSNQAIGYDILAKKGLRTIHVEVKSSTSTCSPALTAREWSQANRLGANYILAVIENFTDTGANTVYWISDPAAKCAASTMISTAHRISRGNWAKFAGPLSSI